MADSPPFPLTHQEWQHVIETLRLTPRQADIVRWILNSREDKEIAKLLKLNPATVRTHLRLLFARHSLKGRMELVIHIFTLVLGREPLPLAAPR